MNTLDFLRTEHPELVAPFQRAQSALALHLIRQIARAQDDALSDTDRMLLHQARDTVAQQCAPWFEAPSPATREPGDVWYCPRCDVKYYAPGECDWHPVQLFPLGVFP